jgi:tetratricopeptide (TPR) repeat protein
VVQWKPSRPEAVGSHPLTVTHRFLFALVATMLTPLLVSQESRESRPTTRPSGESRPAWLGDLVAAGMDLLGQWKSEASWRAADRVVQEGFAAKREGRHDDAVRLFERVGREFPDSHTTISWMLIVSVHQDRDDLDAAVRVIENALAAAVDDDDRSYALHCLATIHERRGDWLKALQAAEKWKPLEGTIAELFGTATAAHRQFRIARCRFHLGEIDTALKLLEAILVGGIYDGVAEDLVVRARQRLASQVAATYAEYSGRSGKLAEARNFATRLGPQHRVLVLDSIRVVEAWLSKDPAAIMKIVAESKLTDEQVEAAGKLVADLGPQAINLLSRRIEAADVSAIRLAGSSGRRELLAPLEKRYEAAGPDNQAVIDAIQNLEAVTSRPSSRPKK